MLGIDSMVGGSIPCVHSEDPSGWGMLLEGATAYMDQRATWVFYVTTCRIICRVLA